MEKKYNEQKQSSDSFFDATNDYSSVVSTMDCTGLMPTLASDAEVEAYADISKIPKPDNQYMND